MESFEKKLGIEREKINNLNKQIIILLDNRFNSVAIISKIKKELGMPIFQANREQEILRRVAGVSKNPTHCIEIFKEIMDQSKRFQEELKCKQV